MENALPHIEARLPAPSPNQQDAILSLAGEVRRVVSLARAMAVSGRRVGLAGLENAVGLLCAKALDLPPNETSAVRAQLVLLGAELDRLTAAIDPNRVSVPDVLRN